MNDKELAEKMELTDLANKLFMYTDSRQWQFLLDEVFTADVIFDMSSLGGPGPVLLPAKEICETWQKGLEELDAIHHQAGHYLVTIKGDIADIYGYSMATHYKKSAKKGNTRCFIGSYDLKASRTERGWRLNQFKFNFKCLDGNATLE
jgi:hypothetical protein